MYHLQGGVLLSLYQGMPVPEDSANIPSTIPEEFRDFLDKYVVYFIVIESWIDLI